MEQVVAQKRDYQRCEVVAALLYIATNVAVVGWLTAGQRLYRSFLLQPPSPPITVSESLLEWAGFCWHGNRVWACRHCVGISGMLLWLLCM